VALEVPASPAGAGPPSDGSPGGDPDGGAPKQVIDDSAFAEPALRGDAAARAKVIRVVSGDVGMGQRLHEIWRSRELLKNLVRTEIKVKYKNSFLGIIWSMISPAMTPAIYFVVFQFIAKNGVPHFVIFLFAGLLPWNLFSVGVLTATGTVVANSGLVKKVSFPREILSLASIGSAGVFFFFQSLVMILFLVVLHSDPDWNFVALLPLALLALIVVSAGLAIFLSAVNVYLRDTQHLVEVLLTAWFWACPIVYVYQASIGDKLGPKGLTWVYFLNPITPIVLTFQRALYAKFTVINTVSHVPLHVLPPKGIGWYAGLDGAVRAVGLLLFFVALWIFGRLEGNFAEEL
jgi:ABC-2 type transport system permease protein